LPRYPESWRRCSGRRSASCRPEAGKTTCGDSGNRPGAGRGISYDACIVRASDRRQVPWPTAATFLSRNYTVYLTV
jgi:hypothetical protein